MRKVSHFFLVGACAGLLGAAAGACAQTAAPLPVRSTLDLDLSHSNLSSGLQQGEAVNLRGVWLLGSGDVVSAEMLQERKFGRRGGILAGAYTRVFSPDWYGTGSVAAGHGGPNWADWRVDLQLSRKWLERRQLVTSVAAYYARFRDDGSDAFASRGFEDFVYDTSSNPISRFRELRFDRSDRGLRLSAAWYFDLPAVLEAGVILNRSQPGGIDSHMPWLAFTVGSQGQQYFSVRVASGTEAYQALGDSQQLVDFRSDSVGASWRRWIGPRWGITVRAESYRNPTYHRQTVGAGVFAQWN